MQQGGDLNISKSALHLLTTPNTHPWHNRWSTSIYHSNHNAHSWSTGVHSNHNSHSWSSAGVHSNHHHHNPWHVPQQQQSSGPSRRLQTTSSTSRSSNSGEFCARSVIPPIIDSGKLGDSPSPRGGSGGSGSSLWCRPASELYGIYPESQDFPHPQHALHTSSSEPARRSDVTSDVTMTKTMSEPAVSSGVTEVKVAGSRSGSRAARRKDVNHVSHQFFHVEPCLYTHRMFQRAAIIFGVLKDQDSESEETKALRRRQGLTTPTQEKIPDMDFINAHEQIKTFELAFATLKYQKLFHEILDRTAFFIENSHLRDTYSLVCIILFDLQSRKFQRRMPLSVDDVIDPLCYQVEEALLLRKTRLLSTIAKERIRHGAPSLEFLLPEQVRHKDETKSRIPVYTWVNQIKMRVEDFLEELHSRDFLPVADHVDMSDQTGHVYRVDRHCPDLVVFPPHLAMYFKDSHWVKQGCLVQQDKSSCLAPLTVRNILAADHDVIHVNVGTGMSTGHIASLLHEESPKSHLWAFGVEGSEKARKVMRNLENLGVKNTKVVLEDFLSVEPEDYRFRNVKVIFLSANCSKSAITSPVQFIVSEGEDMQILGELSKAESDMAHVGNLMKKHERQLKHALRFPKLQAVVYSTRSRYEAENESVVIKATEFVNQTSGKKLPYRVSPPVIPFSSEEISTGQSGVDGRYIKFRPTDKSNGCFVAIISKEPEDPHDAASLKAKRALEKAERAALQAAETGSDSEAVGSRLSKTSGSGKSKKKKKTKGSSRGNHSLPEVTLGEKAAAQGARMYQANLLAKMQNASPKLQRELGLIGAGEVPYQKVVKHPKPFSPLANDDTDIREEGQNEEEE